MLALCSGKNGKYLKAELFKNNNITVMSLSGLWFKGPRKQGHIVADTLLLMKFPVLCKLETFVADTKCF